MSKIVFLATNEEMVRIGNSILPEINEEIEVEIKRTNINNVIDTVRQLEKEDIDAIISRGGTYLIIKEEGIEIPVVEVPVTVQDLALSIQKAKQLANKEDPLIGIIGFQNMIKDIKALSHLLNVRINIYQLFTIDITEKLQAVWSAKNDKVDVIIGGFALKQVAENHGMTAVLLKANKNSIMESFKAAKEIAFARDLEKKKSKELRTIVNFSFDGIISLNGEGIINVFNTAAEKILKRKASQVIGKHIRDVLDIIGEDSVNDVLISGREIFGMILEIHETSVALNFIPISIDNKVTGAILSFQEIDRIQQVEDNIRNQIYLNGHEAKYDINDILGKSEEIREVKRVAEQFAKLDSTVLIIGETGTGKELFAHSIHKSSLRSNGPFVAINCAALPSNLLESELFGYVEGAFTGAAKKGKRGLFDIAHKGTIFLDEISEMDKHGQAALLRVIQERKIMRIGDDKVIPIDVRIIAASNKDLTELIHEKNFREDLYYRLNVLSLTIPPLRDRKTDIIYLADHFIDEYSKKFYKYVELTQGATNVIKDYPWHGNVRQLRSFCERVVATTLQKTIDENIVKMHLSNKVVLSNSSKTIRSENIEKTSIDEIVNLLDKYNGDRDKVAKCLGISRSTLWRRIKKYNIRYHFSK